VGKSIGKRNVPRNYWLDVLMGLLALMVGGSALALWVILPQGYFAARLLWLAIHKWSGLALSIVVLLHVLLHVRWLVRMTRRILKRLPRPDLTGLDDRRQDPDWM
jgi:membrane protein implicated in regulation of membrane protease activity